MGAGEARACEPVLSACTSGTAPIICTTGKTWQKIIPFWFHPFYYFAMLAKMMINLMVVLLSREKIVGTRKPS
jgi:hypothetical protein